MIQMFVSLATAYLPMWLIRLTFSVALVGLAALVLNVLPGRTSAAYRHRVWALSLAASLAMPVFIQWLPEFRIGPRTPSQTAEVPPEFRLPARPTQQTDVPGEPFWQSPIVSPGSKSHHEPPPVRHAASTRPSPASTAMRSIDEHATPSDSDVQSRTASIPVNSIWLLLIVPPAIWKLCRAAQSVWAASRLASTAEAVDDPATLQKLSEIAGCLCCRRQIQLRQSARTAVPLCVGSLRPLIVIPANWQSWPEVTLRAVLAHEIAHIVRRDVAWQHVARVASAVYWFHLAVWLVARQLRIEREVACDDCVLGIVTPPSDYARVLLHFAQQLRTCPTFAADAIAMASGSSLESRVRAMLDGRRPRGPVRPLVSNMLMATTIALAVAAGSVSPAARAVSNDPSSKDKDSSPKHPPNETGSTQALDQITTIPNDLRPQIKATLSSGELLQQNSTMPRSAPVGPAPKRDPKRYVPITGRVVLRSAPKKDVPYAKILGVPLDAQMAYVSAVCDKDGEFHVPAIRGTALFIAQNSDRTLSGLAQFPPKGGELVIAIGTTSLAHGRLVEVSTGKPVPHREISYSVLIDGQKLSLPPGGKLMFCGTTRTNAQGELTLSRLAPGWKYEIESTAVWSGGELLELVEEPKALARFEAPESGAIELDHVKIPPRPSDWTLIAKRMRHTEPFEALLSAKLAHAALAEQRVLILAALPTDPWCQLIFMAEPNGPLMPSQSGVKKPLETSLTEALRNFVILGIDLSDPRIAAGYEEFLTKRGFSGRPKATLVAVDKEGRLLGLRVMTQREEASDRPRILIDFLHRHTPQLPDGQQLLRAALEQAKKENKRILLEETAPDCDPCEQLTRYLEQHKSLLEKDYVLLKLDRRFPNGCSAFTSLQHSAEGGVPCIAILDAQGKTLVDSNSPEGNIGFPESRREISYFEWMLRATAQRLGDQDIATLIRALKKPLQKR
jgi:beta-lactamase regulating signal transducer with metallopeptidase domain